MGTRTLTWILLLMLALAVSARADTVALKADHPERYVVQKGDTLWDISARFLEDPWLWPEIWRANPAIDNPHLIYPGDVVRLVFRDGEPALEVDRDRPLVKLSPKVRSEPIDGAIPTVPMDAIQQFLTDGQVISREQADNAGYLVAMEEGRLVGGANNQIYARGLDNSDSKRFRVFRIGQAYRHPGQQEVLGFEAVHVADAKRVARGDPTTLVITNSNRETLIGDRLLPVSDQEFNHNFLPKAPEMDLQGSIISVFDAVSRVGPHQPVVLNRGSEHGLEPGHVLTVYQSGERVRDTVKPAKGQMVTLPDVRAGLVMVFRVFDQISYALVMRADRDIRLHDAVRNP